jgi:hypothetical protein
MEVDVGNQRICDDLGETGFVLQYLSVDLRRRNPLSTTLQGFLVKNVKIVDRLLVDN